MILKKDEKMDKTTTEAKEEIEAFCQNKINSIAQAALVENRNKFVALENPVKLQKVRNGLWKLQKMLWKI